MGIAVWYSCHGQSLNFVSLEGVFLKKVWVVWSVGQKNAFCITFEQHPIKSGHKPLKRSAHDSCSWTDRLFALLVSAQQHGQQFLSGPGQPRGGRSQLSFLSPAAAALKTRFRPRLLLCCCLDFLHVPKCLWHAANQQLCYCDVRRSIVVCF